MARIGALRVDLGMNTAAFEKGVGLAERKLNRFAGNMQKLGTKMQGIGKNMALGLTAPLVGVGAAFGKLTHDLATNAKEMQTSANVAGESFEKFQKQAHAAKTVGIEFEKLGDIFKDVRDRVGDFAATGGGPMADFFEKIAPKVGITQEAFKGLSGKDGLQLYYNSLVKAGASQEEIVFYMEAMASDATNLIPLLRDNGKALKELGENATIIGADDAEALKRYTDAQTKMGHSVRALTIALVDSGILDVITSLIDKVSAWTKRLSETNPVILKVAVSIAAIVAAVGPVIGALGMIVSGIGSLTAAMAPLLAVIGTAFAQGGVFIGAKVALVGFGAALGPILAPIAAFAAAGYLIYKNWSTIAPVLQDLWASVEASLGPPLRELISTLSGVLKELWAGPFGDMIKATIPLLAKFQGAYVSALGQGLVVIIKAAAEIIGALFAQISDGVKLVSALFNGEWSAAFEYAWSIVNRTFGGLPNYVIEQVRKLYQGVKEWISTKLGAVWQGVTDKIETVKRSFYDLYDAVVGHSYIPDMVDGIAQNMARLDSVMVEKAKTTTEATKAAFREMAAEVRGLLDKLFPEAARFRQLKDDLELIDKGKAGGLLDDETAEAARSKANRDYIAETYGDVEGPKIMKDPIGATRDVREASVKIGKEMGVLAEKAEVQTVKIAQSVADMVSNTVNSLKGLKDAIKSGDFLDIFAAILDVFRVVSNSGIFKGSGTGSSNPFGGARAMGGPVSFGKSYLVGENGPEMFTPGASGAITPNHAMGGGIAQIIPSPYFNVVVDGRIMDAAPSIASAGGQSAMGKIQQMRKRRLG